MDEKASSKYQFFPSAPITAWLVLAGLVIVGIALLNLDGRGWVLTGIGILIACLIGAIFLVLSIYAAKLVVEFDDYGYRINNGDEVQTGAWTDVTSVSSTPDGGRLIIRRGPVARDFIIPPRGSSAKQMDQLTLDLQRRLATSQEL